MSVSGTTREVGLEKMLRVDMVMFKVQSRDH